MGQVWQRLGFDDTPYRGTPLEPTSADAELFTGREKESARFLTLMDTHDGCVIVVSGDGGIGKTSFVNVQQYWLASGQASLAPDLLISRSRAVIIASDDERSLAQRIVHITIGNVIAEFRERAVGVPKQIKKIEEWLSHKGHKSGIDIGLQILGVGGNIARAITLPAVSETTLEGWQDVLCVIVSECIHKLDVEGIIVCLDNSSTVTDLL